jgi:nicotinate-nucleotide adenylyltransferase
MAHPSARPGSRKGLFGGTFDPPHVGHLALAEWAREQLKLDEVLFVPVGRPPHKRATRLSSAGHRLAMARLATRGNTAFRVSGLEVEAATPSYTVDTLRRLRARHPRDRWYLIIGSDSLDEFHTWREPETILELSTLAVAGRPGCGEEALRRWGRRREIVSLGNPGLDVSSTMVRARARAGRSLRYLVPDLVASYIVRHRLYQAARAGRRS